MPAWPAHEAIVAPMRPTIAAAREILRSRFGYPDFRPRQTDVVASVLEGRDTLAILPTGGGKSLCYQVPALALPGLTIVVSPLISLMQDQVDRLVGKGVAAAFHNSTLDDGATATLLRRLARGEMKLLYVAPERLGAADLRAAIPAGGVSLIAVDEAHCISEWGHEFRPSFRCIALAAEAYGNPPILAVTATATPTVRRDIATQLKMRAPRIIVGGFDRPNLHYAVQHCRSDDAKMRALVTAVQQRVGAVVVYAPTRATVEALAGTLRRSGARAVPYHAGLEESRRRETQEAFMAGRADIIVATNAFGMGVDKPDVRLVVHFTFPRTLEAYYQEAGRAGRDGSNARCLLLYTRADRHAHDWSIAATFPDRSSVEQAYARLRARRGKNHHVERSSDPAIAFLIRQNVVIERRAGARFLRVRVTATPAQLRRAFAMAPDADAQSVLRALWRLGAPARQWEVPVALADIAGNIPPRRARDALERLRDRRLISFIELDDALELAHPDAASAELALDWSQVERRRTVELEKLAWMRRYVETSGCRRALALRYFGESPAATCSACDNCVSRWYRRLLPRAAPFSG